MQIYCTLKKGFFFLRYLLSPRTVILGSTDTASSNIEVLMGCLGFWGQLNLGIYMKDSETDVSVLVDRALGGASIADGQLEIMLHRYFFHIWFETCETKGLLFL